MQTKVQTPDIIKSLALDEQLRWDELDAKVRKEVVSAAPCTVDELSHQLEKLRGKADDIEYALSTNDARNERVKDKLYASLLKNRKQRDQLVWVGRLQHPGVALSLKDMKK